MQKSKSVLNGVLFITQGSGVSRNRNFPLASLEGPSLGGRRAGAGPASSTETNYGKMVGAPGRSPQASGESHRKPSSQVAALFE